MKKTRVVLSILAALVLTGCEFSFTSGSMGSAGEGSTSSSIDSGVTSSDPTSSEGTSTSDPSSEGTSTGTSSNNPTSSGGTSTGSSTGTSSNNPTSSGGASIGASTGTSIGTSTAEGVQPVNSDGGNSNVVRIRKVNEEVGWSTLESIGEQKILVVPVRITNGTAWSTTMLNNLESAFFGDGEDTTWESVSSFYYKSSYGQLNITGEVTDVYNYTARTVTQLNNRGDYASDDVISAWESSNSISAEKRREYDQDGDGLIDCAVFIYSNSYNIDGSGAYWAWCFFMETAANRNVPVVNNYMWASYTYMQNTYDDRYNQGKIDAHTYIHETGHLLGLDDYYCYDSSNAWDPAGQLEMQSYNVGDQNIYSKYALGWITPTHAVTSTSVTYNLETSASKPQAILINDNWNGTPFDEYLMLEYYTPTGLNETDSNHAFDNRSRMYNYSGIRLYHVDARIAKLRQSGQNLNFVEYVDEIGNDNYIYYIGASNSYSWSYLNSPYNRVYRYVHLLDQGGQNRLNNGYGGSVNRSTALWTAGNSFSASSTFFYNGTNFNKGNSVGYSIRVDSISDTNAQVTITKI